MLFCYVLVFYLLLYYGNCAPVRGTHQHDQSDSPARKQSKLDDDNSQTSSTASSEKCYFSVPRTTSFETKPRDRKSKVSEECQGELVEMKKLMDVTNGKLYGAPNFLEVIVSRGEGTSDVNWDDENEVASWSKRKICAKHLKELGTDWNRKRYHHIYYTRRGGNVIETCSMPRGIGISHKSYRPHASRRVLSVPEAKAILVKEGKLVHAGIPLCQDHKKYAQQLLGQVLVDDTISIPSDTEPMDDLVPHSSEIDTNSEPQSNDEDYGPHAPRLKHTISEDVRSKFIKFVTSAKEHHLVARKPFQDLTRRVKQKKAAHIHNIFETIYSIAAPDAPGDLKALVTNNEQNQVWSTSEESKFFKLMKSIANSYHDAENRAERVNVLSLVANIATISEIRLFIPGLNSRMYYAAKQFARRAKEKEDFAHHLRDRYHPQAVNSFIDFITSGAVLVGLPYGYRKAKLSDGSTIEIPNTLRQQRAVEIINMYEEYMKEAGNTQLFLSRATLYRILNICSASPRKSTTCVDYFVGDAMDAIDDMMDIIDKWKQDGQINEEWNKKLKFGLQEGIQYLRTDYRIHTKEVSRVADHCSKYALSDPVNQKLSASCENEDHSHKHDLVCDRCEQVKHAIADVLDTIKDLLRRAKATNGKHPNAANKLILHTFESHLNRINKDVEKIMELKKHQIRSQFTNQQRTDIISNLKDNQALVTMDYAQKFLPLSHREKQSDYFGKRGISYHISHVLAKIGDKQVQHSMVHILKNELQDSMSVTQILSHTLRELKLMGIHSVILRSDNAGTYHSSTTLASIFSISEESGVEISRYTFSEPQNGKSSCDRMASHVKRTVKDFVDSNHDVTTPDQFFTALTVKRPLLGVSVYLCQVENAPASTTKFPGISNYFDFRYHHDGLMAHRFDQIGVGEFYAKQIFVPNKGKLVIEKEGGFLAANFDMKTERGAILDGKRSQYWFTLTDVKNRQLEPEEKETETAIEEEHDDSMNPTNKDKLFQCPTEGCAATYLRFKNLEKHQLSGKHQISPERTSLRDYALGMFIKNIEEIDSARCVPIVANAADSLDKRDSDKPTELEKGWALRKKKPVVRFTDNAKEFLDEIFDKGQAGKKMKMDPKDVEHMMETATRTDGTPRFQISERLNSRQIASYFSRLSEKRNSKKGKSKRSTDDAAFDLNEDEGDEELVYLKDAQTVNVDDEYHSEVSKARHTIFALPDEPVHDAIKDIYKDDEE